ncbi:hypothetical protein FHX06_005707 [Rhizobium sp. BK512]|nr:hypothetical protein [Rhizobium sp. BK512]
MGSILIGGAVFASLVAATLIGMALRARLPEHHLDAASKDVIRLATAVVGTLSALALGLLIASAKTDFDGADAELRSSIGRVVLLDRILAQYGDETSEARGRLHELIETRLKSGWSGKNEDEAAGNPYDVSQTVEPVQVAIRALTPADDARRILQSRALVVSGEIAEAHWMAVESGTEGLPTAFLMILVFWLAGCSRRSGFRRRRIPRSSASSLYVRSLLRGRYFWSWTWRIRTSASFMSRTSR